MRLCGACEPDPRRIRRAPPAERMKADIDDNELEPGRRYHLGAHHRLFHRPRPDPEEPPQVDAIRLGELRIEVVTEIDQRDCFAHRRRGGEGRENDRETSGCMTRNELDEPAACEAAAEEGIDGLECGRDEQGPLTHGGTAKQLGSAPHACRDRRIESLTQLPERRTLPRFYGRWRRNERGGWPARFEIEKLELPVETRSRSSHGESAYRLTLGGNEA